MDSEVPQRVSEAPQKISGFSKGFWGSQWGSGVSSIGSEVLQRVLGFLVEFWGSSMGSELPQRISGFPSWF